MIRVFLKNGTQVDVPKAMFAEFVDIDELQVKKNDNSWSKQTLASFPHSEVSGFMVMDEPEPESKPEEGANGK